MIMEVVRTSETSVTATRLKAKAVPLHDTKAQGVEEEVQHLLIIDLGTRWG
jgi:hypothetical protein